MPKFRNRGFPRAREEPYLNPPHSPFVIVNRDRGEINLFNGGPAKTCRVIEDGKPVQFVGDKFYAQLAENTLAFTTAKKQNGPLVWWLFDVTDKPVLLGEFNLGQRELSLFRLSPDGKSFAMPFRHDEVTVRTVGEGSTNCLVTARARVHNNLSVYLGKTQLEIVVGRNRHALSWQKGPLEHKFSRMSSVESQQAGLIAALRDLNNPRMRSDTHRFTAVATVDVEILVDVAGQVIVRDFHNDQLTCIFLVRREQFAAWMPDGTRYGPTDLIGGPATPGI